MPNQPEIYQYRLLKISEVENLTGKSRTGIYSDPTFPRPVKIGLRASAWAESEVHAWIAGRVAERDNGKQ